MWLCELGRFSKTTPQWIEEALEGQVARRDDRWSEAIAVGNLAFLEKVKGELGVKALHREFEQLGGAYALRERSDAYVGELASQSDALRLQNTICWNESAETAET